MLNIPTQTPTVIGRLLCISVLVSCGDSPTAATRNPQAVAADTLFWSLIHGEDYQRFGEVVTALETATAADPSDVYAAAHLGWAHFWGVAEGTSLGLMTPAEVPEHLLAAERAFARAVELAPEEPRIRGFLGYVRSSLGMQEQAGADVAASIEMWPEWAFFGSAYGVDAVAPYDSEAFNTAVEAYWRNLDVCANVAVDRQNPDWAPYLAQRTLTGPDRACWGSWISPHNLEGYFLIMGDALVKQGNIDVAAVIYNNATLLPNYDAWPFKVLLEARIANRQANVALFRQAPTAAPLTPETSMISASSVSCAICHRGDADAHYQAPDWVGANANEYPRPF